MGWGRGFSLTQQSRTVLQGMGGNHWNVQPRSGVMQSQLGPLLRPGLVRKFSGTPPLSATQRPAARSTTQARGWQGALAIGARCGLRVQPPFWHRQVPGGGADSSQVRLGCGSTQRVGMQGSSQPQSESDRHATTERWSRPARAGAFVGAVAGAGPGGDAGTDESPGAGVGAGRGAFASSTGGASRFPRWPPAPANNKPSSAPQVHVA